MGAIVTQSNQWEWISQNNGIVIYQIREMDDKAKLYPGVALMDS